jgi:hypothetical protein
LFSAIKDESVSGNSFLINSLKNNEKWLEKLRLTVKNCFERVFKSEFKLLAEAYFEQYICNNNNNNGGGSSSGANSQTSPYEIENLISAQIKSGFIR